MDVLNMHMTLQCWNYPNIHMNQKVYPSTHESKTSPCHLGCGSLTTHAHANTRTHTHTHTHTTFLFFGQEIRGSRLQKCCFCWAAKFDMKRAKALVTATIRPRIWISQGPIEQSIKSKHHLSWPEVRPSGSWWYVLLSCPDFTFKIHQDPFSEDSSCFLFFVLFFFVLTCLHACDLTMHVTDVYATWLPAVLFISWQSPSTPIGRNAIRKSFLLTFLRRHSTWQSCYWT